MALKLKRAIADWETAKKSVEQRIESDTGAKVTLDLDLDTIKANTGETTWVNSVMIGRDEATVRMFAEQAQNYYFRILAGFEWEGTLTAIGKKLFAENIEKIVFAATHKDGANHYGNKGDHVITQEGKTWKWLVYIDYSSYISQNPAEQKYVVRELLEKAGTQYHFLHRKVQLEKALADTQARMDGTTQKPLPLVVDYEGIAKLEGQTVLSNDIKEPASGASLYCIGESIAKGVCYAIEQLCKDDLGKEALAESFTAFVIHVEAGAKDIDVRKWSEHKFEKKGTELHLTVRLDFSSYICQSFPYSELCGAIEGML